MYSTWHKGAMVLVSGQKSKSYENLVVQTPLHTVLSKRWYIAFSGLPAYCLRSWAVGRFQLDRPYRGDPKYAYHMPRALAVHGQKEFGAFAAVKSGQPVRVFGQEKSVTTLLSSSPKCKAQTWSFGAENSRFA